MNEITIIFFGLVAHVFPLGGWHAALLLDRAQHNQILVAPGNTTVSFDFTSTTTTGGDVVYDIGGAWFTVGHEEEQEGIGTDPIPELPRLKDIATDSTLEDDVAKVRPFGKIGARLFTDSRDISVVRYYEKKGKFENQNDAECIPCGVRIKIKARKKENRDYVRLLSGSRWIEVKTGTTILMGSRPKSGSTGHFHKHGDIVKGDIVKFEETNDDCGRPNPCVKSDVRFAGVECSSSQWP
jgi:hypothetical protein